MKTIAKMAVALALILLPGVTFAGAQDGPQQRRDTVKARTTDMYTIVFDAHTLARITVSGDGSTDLDCDVTDSNRNIVASDRDETDQCILVWNPAWTGKFVLRIQNHGNIPNEYSLRTN